MEKKDKRALLWTIIALAWPTMLEEVLQTAVQYVDTAMVGRLGTAATAAVGSTSTVNWVVNGSISALGVGFLAYISKALGAGKKEKAVRAVAQVVLTVLVVGVFFTFLTLSLSGLIPVWMKTDGKIRQDASLYFRIVYAPMLFRTAIIIFGTVLRASGDTKTPMRVGLGVNAVNVVLNYFLINPSKTFHLFGGEFVLPRAGMGIAGAALATSASFVFGGIFMFIRVWNHPMISPKGQSMKPSGEILRPCLKVAIPNMLQRFCTSLGYVVFASMINALGDVSTAAHTIADTVESLFYIPGYGMQSAAATLAGNTYGAKDPERMRMLPRLLLPMEMLMMTISGALLFLLAEPLVRVFSADNAVVELGTRVLRMVAVTEPFFGASIIIEGMMMGVGRTVTPFILNVIGMWMVRIIGTFICTRMLGLGMVSAWACMIAHNMLLFCCYSVLLIKGSWNPLKGEAAK